MTKLQFNIRLPKQMIKRVAAERIHANTTKDMIGLVALEDFFSRHSLAQREAFYRAQRLQMMDPQLRAQIRV